MQDVAADVVRRLRRLGIEYYITGSEALARYGEPRQTADIDIVLQLTVHEFEKIRSAFEDDYVVNEPMDCANLLRTNAEMVDWRYLERYAQVLGIDKLLARLRAATA